MKTLVLATVSAAALLSASAAFADPAVPTPAVSQLGSGGMDANTSTMIDQVGNSNNASVNQTGATNVSSVVLQTSTGATGQGDGAQLGASSYYNSATVNQFGSGARSLVTQASNAGANSETATVNQTGSNEYAFVAQDSDAGHSGSGGGNQATVNQASSNAQHDTGNLFGVNGRGQAAAATTAENNALALQGGTLETFATTGSGSYGATIVETGAVEQATVTQHGSNNAALITTQGDGTRDTITQYDGSYNNAAAIRQDGSANNNGINAFNPNGTINQFGSNGSASIEQANMGFAANITGPSAAVIDQYGDQQTARITQTSPTFGGRGGHDTATINQYGAASMSFARTTQDGGSSTADTEQSGYMGYATTAQHDTGATANVNQSGQYDASIVVQGGSKTSGAGNTVNVNQTGYQAYSSVSQDGNSNTAGVGQAGYYNVSMVTQNGDHNTVDSYQGGSKGYSAVVQNGNYNMATVRH